jgi:C-3',4' desaturase CrtD
VNEVHSDVLVLGAGFGGLSAAALLAKQGIQVNILESHVDIGGCAGEFKRKGLSFNVGATTISGFAQSKPIYKLCQELGILEQANESLTREDIGLIICKNSKRIRRYSDHVLWLKELSEHFPSIDHKLLWDKLALWDRLAWQMISSNQRLMPSGFLDYLILLKPSNLKGLLLLPELFRSFAQLLTSLNINNREYLELMQELLMITAQNDSSRTPSLMAALGLMYPAEVFYCKGSINSLAHLILDSALSNQASIHYKHKVVNITQEQNIYKVTCSNQKVFFAKKVISNIPIWNLSKIANCDFSRQMNKFSSRFENAPAAFVVNFSVKIDFVLESHFYQIHVKQAIPQCYSSSIFVSFSEQKEPGSYTVTISTHCHADDWLELKEDDYKQAKLQTQSIILEELHLAMPELVNYPKEFLMSATPKSYEFFTSRFKGQVGGIPYDLSNPPWTLCPNRFDDFYLVGDTTFPGQGIASVVYSAMSAVAKLNA